MRKAIYILCLSCFINVPSFATTWHVGPSQTYTMPSQVSALVQNGDTVAIDSGIYAGDVAHWTADDLVFMGMDGMARLHSGGNVWGGKAIWVISGNNALVENIDFAEASCIDQNGAGIRQEGTNLTVRHCYFHDNEDGILSDADANSTILIEYTEFDHNGFGDGYSHNLYIGHINTLIFRYNYSHHAKIGHELKSRANNNYILYNRISNEDTGTASRNIDLPNGGKAIIVGNIIEQGPNTQNSNIMEFGLEGLTNPDSLLYIVNNTFVNDKGNGSFIQVQNGINLLKSYNNIFAGPGTVYVGSATTYDTSHNWNGAIAAAGLTAPANYNYTLLATSPAVDNGTYPGMADTFSLVPLYEYEHPDSAVARPVVDSLDIGAYEYGTPTAYVGNISVPKDLIVYPNPAGDRINVLCQGQMNRSVSLYDVNGRKVMESTIGAGAGEFSISTKGLIEGVYYLRCGSMVKAISIKH